MIDENTFKDVYDILVGIGKEWDNLTDAERASLGEALAGKRNSNALFSVLQNIELLENVYETAENSAGSAAREQENYAKTIQYSINVFKASAQELATQILDSAVVKEIVDAGTNLISAFSNLAKIVSPFITLLGKAISMVIQFASLISKNPVGAIFEVAALAKYIVYIKNSTTAKTEDTLATLAEKAAVDSETVSEATNTASKTANIVTTNSLTSATIKETAAATSLKGAIDLLTASFKGLSLASKLALGITAVFTAIEIGKKIFDAFTVSTDELKENAESSASKVSELESELSNIQSQIDTLKSKGPLTLIQQEELDKLTAAEESLNGQLRINKEIAKQDAMDYETEAIKKINNKEVYANTEISRGSNDVEYLNGKYMTPAEAFNQYLDNYEEIAQLIQEEEAKGEDADYELINKYKKMQSDIDEDIKNVVSQMAEDAEGITGATSEGAEYLNLVNSTASEYELYLVRTGKKTISDLSEAAKRLYLVKKAQDASKNEDVIKYLNETLTADELDKLLNLGGFSFDEVETIDDLKELLNKVNDTVEDETKFKLGSMFEESENKAGTDVTLADLQAEADVLKTINESLEEGQRLTTSTMKEILDNYPEAEDSLRKYMIGLIDEQTLFEELKNIYATDQEYYNAVLRNELANSHEFMQAVLDGNVELYNAIKDVYGDDYNNFKSLAEMKLDLEKNLINSLLKAWAGYADVMSNMSDGLTYEQYEAQLQAQVDSKQISEEMMAEYLLAWNNTNQKAIELHDKINAAINNTANYDLPDTSWQSLSSLSSSDSDSSSSETETQFDWIERVINRISIAYNRLKNVVSDTTDTWLNRNNALENSIRTLSEEISAQQQAYSYYMTLFNQANLSTEYKNLIANGRIAVETITNSDLADAINEAQDWYDKAQSALDEVQNLGIELKELSKTRFDNVKSEYEEFINQIEHSTSMLQNQQDLLEAQGYLASTALYSNLITTEQKNLELLVSEYNSLINAMNQFTGEKYSETWYDMQSDINSVAEAIQEAKKQLVEYNNEMRQVKWDSFDRVRDTVQDIID